MGRLEDIASQYATNARHALSEALDHICSLDEEGNLGDYDLGRIADHYHHLAWWQQVTDLTHGIENTVDGGTAVLTVRQRAQQFLLEARTPYGGAFALAMAESRRAAAQTFLDKTRQLADALTTPPTPDARPDDTYGGHAGPLPDPWNEPPVF
ncbi:hypothetical protein ACFWY5_57070 [Nonomuraea sp. NPDC059007]|uniref:hypothetical protein n=1 Tax=Nonomuraea sp. NPDC059007 TaxID=3346692 RepID=UPI003680C981